MKSILLVCILNFCLLNTTFGKSEIRDLTCEYKKNPIGISTKFPRLSWKIISDEMNQVQTAYQILVASSPGLLTTSRADLWNSQKTQSSQSVHVEYAGKELGSRQKCWWIVRIWDKNGRVSMWSQPAYFEMGLLNPDDWQAQWIKTAIDFDEYSYPSPYMRKEFFITKSVESARLYVTSKGLYEFYINDEKVGDQVFTPGYTSYQKRIQYQVYDITTMLKRGTNASGVILGNGWYRVFNPNNLPMADIQDLEVLAQIEMTYSDGSRQVIFTDGTWKSSTGAVIRSEIFNGEIYDARLNPQGWDRPGFNDNSWEGVINTRSSKDNLASSISEPVRKIEEIVPVKVIFTPEGDTVLDMGQNMVGWCRIRVNAPEGTIIKLRHAEVLDENGNFYIDNLRGAKQEVVYICKGGDITEIYEPRFTFQGFRYVAVSGYPSEMALDLITGIVVHSDLEMTGTFNCNDELINQLQSNIIWGQKGNFLDIPTDCPQRNERLGWTGDLQVFAPTACFNMHSAAFFTKWLKDLAADQKEDGQVPIVVPARFRGYGSTGWSDAALIVPWNLYLNYGDMRILREQYASMKAWVEFMRTEAAIDYLWRPQNRQIGDWLAFATTRPDFPGATTDKDLLANAYYYHSTDLLQKTAQIIGNTEDAAFYQDLKSKIRAAFNNEYVTPNGRLSSNTQTAYVVALSFDLLPKHLEKVAAKRLAEDVNDFGHITTGFLGTGNICHILTRYGYLEEAYKLLYRKEYPSWLYPVTKGATTIWERWDGIKPDGTFQNPEMNSFNHYAYGAVGGWLYKVVAGINFDSEIPGYKHIVIHPHPCGTMNDVKASYESPYGKIVTEWVIKDNTMSLTVEIPPNTSSVVYIPSTGKTLNVNGEVKDHLEIINKPNLKYYFLKTEIGSGRYIFEANFSRN